MTGRVIVRRRQGRPSRYLQLRWEADAIVLEWTDCRDLATAFESEEKVRATLVRYPAGKEFLDNADIVPWKGQSNEGKPET
jgi:hypothetical protein